MFAKMTRGEWEKPVSGTSTKRTDALKLAIRNGDPIPDIKGKDLNLKATNDNIKAVDNFVNSKDATFLLTLKNGGTVVSNQIGKSPLFGGKGKGAGATGNTAKGEALQCLYLAALFGEGKDKEFSHFTPDTLKKYASVIDTDKSFKDMMSSEAAWHYSAYVSGKYLIQKRFVNSTHIFHRGSRTMNAIYAMKKMAFKKDGKPMMNDDKWNPGDIWAVKKGINVSSVLDASSVAALNASLKAAYDKRLIVGISLKQINRLDKKAKHTEYNLEGADLGVHKYSRSILKSPRASATFWSFKGGFIFYDTNKKMDVRAPNAMGALNVEIQGKGARGGRAGYAAIQYAARTHLGVKLPDNSEIKGMAKLMDRGRNERLAKTFWQKVNRIHKDVGWDDFWADLKTASLDRIHANLGATEIISALDKAPRNKRDDFVSYIVNTAGSKTGESSVYVKVETA